MVNEYLGQVIKIFSVSGFILEMGITISISQGCEDWINIYKIFWTICDTSKYQINVTMIIVVVITASLTLPLYS